MEDTITTQLSIFMEVKQLSVNSNAVAYFYHKSQREGKIFIHRMIEAKTKHLASLQYTFDTTGVDILVYPAGKEAWLPPVTQEEDRPAVLRISFFEDDFIAPLRECLRPLLEQ